MKNRLMLIAAVMLLACVPLAMAEEYSFHLDYTDGRTALLAGPKDLLSKLSEEHLAKAAANQVFAFTNVAGAHFTWLSLGCGSKPECEFRLNARGSCKPGECDFGVRRETPHTVSLLCLRENCRFRVTANGSQADRKMKGSERATFPLGSEFVLTFEGKSIDDADR